MDIEEAEIEMCKRHKRYFEDTKGIGTFPLYRKHWFKKQVDSKEISVCLKHDILTVLNLSSTVTGAPLISKDIGIDVSIALISICAPTVLKLEKQQVSIWTRMKLLS